MLLELTAEGELRRIFETYAATFKDACDEAVLNTTGLVKDEAKRTVAAALGNRAGNTITAKSYVSQNTGRVKGFVYSRWWRGAGGRSLGSSNSPEIAGGEAPRGGGSDILWAFTQGPTIRREGGYLYVSFLPRTRSRGRFEISFDDDLITTVPFTSRKTGAHGWLVFDAAGGSSVPDPKGTGKKRRRKVKPEKRLIGMVIDQVKLPRKLDMAPVEAFAERTLGEQLLLSLSRRSIDLYTD